MTKTHLKTKDITIIALLIALGVISAMPFPQGLTFYTFGNAIKISPLFLLVGLGARKYGIIGGVVVSFIVDLLQAVLSSNPPNPIICISSILTGLVFGIYFKNEVTFLKILQAVLITQILCSMVITTLGIWIYYQTPLPVLIYSRAIQSVFYIVLEIIIFYFLFVKTDILKRIKFL